jgi:hypothetical protein
MMVPDTFWRHVNREEECWIWIGPKNNGNGGPALWVNGKYCNPIALARVSAGLEPPGRGKQRVLACGNLMCVSPEHNTYMSVEERFWSKVAIAGPDQCWLWTGAATGNNGYGRFYITSNHSVPAHKYAFEITNGVVVPADKDVMHSCDTPLCVNPSHLSPGTHKENMEDMVAKGRSGGQRKTQALLQLTRS